MQDYTDFKERAEITLLDGTILEFNEDDFTLSNNSISDGAGVSSIPLGVAVGRSVQLELMNVTTIYENTILLVQKSDFISLFISKMKKKM